MPFHDVDALHVVWHGHYYKYLELAREVTNLTLARRAAWGGQCGTR